MKLRNLIYIVKRDIFVSDLLLCIADDELDTSRYLPKY